MTGCTIHAAVCLEKAAVLHEEAAGLQHNARRVFQKPQFLGTTCPCQLNRVSMCEAFLIAH
eukprot:1155568-Pelagomonas_calceolata.AAC.6